MTTYLTERFEGTLPGQFTSAFVELGVSMVLQNQYVLSGLQALRMTNVGLVTNESAKCNYVTSLLDAWTKLNIKIINNPIHSAGTHLWLAWTMGPRGYNSSKAYFGIEQKYDGTTRWVLAYYTGLDASGGLMMAFVNSAPITLDNDWHEIKLHCLSSANGLVEAYVDGIIVAQSPVYDTTTTGNATEIMIGMINNVSYAPFPVWDIAYDDAIIADTDPGGVIPPSTIQLNVVAGIGGSVSPSGLLTLTIGASYQFTVAPGSGYTFNHWDLAGQNISTTPSLILPTTATMNGQTLTAVFNAQLNGYLSVSTLAGTTPINASVTADGQSGTTPVTFSFPAGTYSVVASYQGETLPPQTVTITAGQTTTLNLQFPEPQPTTITLNVTAGAGGTVNPVGLQTLTVGQSYQFFATANSGDAFNHWDLNGTSISTSQSIIMLVTAGMDGQTLTALFTVIPPTPVTVTVAVLGNGTTDLTPGTHEFHVGDTITIAAIPSAGTAFKRWQLDGVSYTDNPLSLPVTESLNGQTLTAEFESIGPISAGFPIWVVVPTAIILIGAYALSRRGKNHRG